MKLRLGSVRGVGGDGGGGGGGDGGGGAGGNGGGAGGGVQRLLARLVGGGGGPGRPVGGGGGGAGPPGRWIAQVDGAIGVPGGATGLGVAIRDASGAVCHVASRRAGPMTNNEAEYSAVILALEMLGGLPRAAVDVVSDSEIVVFQMQGHFSVNSPALKVLHRRACALARGFEEVRFVHVPRDRNGLADALAREALWSDAPWSAGSVARREGREQRGDVHRRQLRRRR